jgi:AcrR family transcriptional regulator
MTSLTRRRRRSHSSSSHRERLPRAERERQMLLAAHVLFADRGYAGVTMDDVAEAVGVTKPLLYKYFGNKERLYLACMGPAGDLLVRTVVDAVTPTATPADALRAGLFAFFEFLDTDRDAWRVLFDETLPVSGEVAQGVAEYRDRVTELVATAVLTQLPPERRPVDRGEVEALSTAVLGAAEALGRWWLRTQAITAREAAELLISTVEPGLRLRTRHTVEARRSRRGSTT